MLRVIVDGVLAALTYRVLRYFCLECNTVILVIAALAIADILFNIFRALKK